MSDEWQPFFDDLVSEASNTRAKCLSGAVGLIMGPDGSYLAGSPKYSVTAKEAQAIVKGFDTAAETFGGAGVFLRGKKYKFSKNDTEFVLCKEGKQCALLFKSGGENYVVLEFDLDVTKNTAENAMFYVGKWVDANLTDAGF